MKTIITVVTAVSIQVLLIPAVQAQSAGETYDFARELWEDGDDAFALLEFKRFAYHHPDHQQAPVALLRVGLIYAGYLQDLTQADKTLTQVTDRYPNSDAAEQARQLQQFIKNNDDYDKEPLKRFLRAQMDAAREDYGEAADSYLAIPERWPRARLADRALLEGAKLELRELEEPREAARHLERFLDRYPNSERVPDARFELAAARERLHDDPQRAIGSYRDVIDNHPNTDFARRAQDRIAALRKGAGQFTREYDTELVRKYKIMRSGYTGRNRYTIAIQLSSQSSAREVAATLEDALLHSIAERKDKNDSARVEAYFNYPLTKAGLASWAPGEDPKYRIEERDTEDVLKDTLLDMLMK